MSDLGSNQSIPLIYLKSTEASCRGCAVTDRLECSLSSRSIVERSCPRRPCIKYREDIFRAHAEAKTKALTLKAYLKLKHVKQYCHARLYQLAISLSASTLCQLMFIDSIFIKRPYAWQAIRYAAIALL